MYVKVEKWARFSPGFVDDKVVKRVVLEEIRQTGRSAVQCKLTCGMMRSSYARNTHQ